MTNVKKVFLSAAIVVSGAMMMNTASAVTRADCYMYYTNCMQDPGGLDCDLHLQACLHNSSGYTRTADFNRERDPIGDARQFVLSAN